MTVFFVALEQTQVPPAVPQRLDGDSQSRLTCVSSNATALEEAREQAPQCLSARVSSSAEPSEPQSPNHTSGGSEQPGSGGLDAAESDVEPSGGSALTFLEAE